MRTPPHMYMRICSCIGLGTGASVHVCTFSPSYAHACVCACSWGASSFCLFSSLPFSSPLYQELIRLVDPSIDLSALKSLGSTLKAPDVLNKFKALRAAINTRCFFQELGETGMIFSQLEHFFATFRPQMWESLKGKTEEHICM